MTRVLSFRPLLQCPLVQVRLNFGEESRVKGGEEKGKAGTSLLCLP